MEDVKPTVEEERAHEALMRRNQTLLDEEMELLDREEQLAQRQRHLEEYEAEVSSLNPKAVYPLVRPRPWQCASALIQ